MFRFLNTSHVDILDKFRKSVVDKVKTDIFIQKKIIIQNKSYEKKYASKQNFGTGDTATCVYQFIYDKNSNDETKIIQYFVMRTLGLCVKVYSHVANMFYAWSFSHNTSTQIDIKKKRHFNSLNTYTSVFTWCTGNSNKIELNNYINQYDKNEIKLV